MAPRKPERFARGRGARASRGPSRRPAHGAAVDAEPHADVVILDTIGELAHLFQVATVVFVGGSLVDQGGHNILEPAVHGKPIVFGPHMQNFAEIAETFLKSQAAIQVADAGELAEVVVRLAGDPVERARLGAAARALVEANRGAKPRTLDGDRDAPAAARAPRRRAAVPAVEGGDSPMTGPARRSDAGLGPASNRRRLPVISRRQPRVGRARQDAGRRPPRAAAPRRRRAARRS